MRKRGDSITPPEYFIRILSQALRSDFAHRRRRRVDHSRPPPWHAWHPSVSGQAYRKTNAYYARRIRVSRTFFLERCLSLPRGMRMVAAKCFTYFLTSRSDFVIHSDSVVNRSEKWAKNSGQGCQGWRSTHLNHRAQTDCCD